MFRFSPQLLSGTFPILRTFQRDIIPNLHWCSCKVGHPVAQLVEALHRKSEDRGFDSRWCYWNFSLIQSFRSHYGPGVGSASNRNEYQEYFPGVKAADA